MTTIAKNDPSQLTHAERATILALLEEYANALAIYHSTLRKPLKRDNRIPIDCILPDTEYVADLDTFNKIVITSDDTALTSRCDPEVSNALLDFDETAKIEDEKQREKFYENSLYVRKIVEDLKEEIRQEGTFEVLTKEVEEIIAREKEEEALQAENKRLKKVAAELQETIASEKIANDEEKKRILNELSEEQKSAEKVKLMAKTKLEYLIAWEEAKREQNALRCDMEAEKLEKILNDRLVREKTMERVHRARTKYLIQETVMLEKRINEWEERYIREKKMYEREIHQLRINIVTKRQELEELKEEHRRKQEFIDTYLAEKEALRKAEEAKQRARISAIRIQAWWRGVMVRRKLGPYRPEEKKKKRLAKGKK